MSGAEKNDLKVDIKLETFYGKYDWCCVNDFINKLSKKCQQHCQHSEKPKPFPCPICFEDPVNTL